MKKFFTAISLQGTLRPQNYESVGNQRLAYDRESCFPIIPAISGYAVPGEDFRVIALLIGEKKDANANNFATLEQELNALCGRKGLVCSRGIETLQIPADDTVSTHVSAFQRLIDFTEDDDTLYYCMTYGTKPASQALMMAMRYAVQIHSNAYVECAVYGGMDWTQTPPKAKIYDETALIKMQEIVTMLAQSRIKNPKDFIDNIIGAGDSI